ncbi:MAG TPA: M28 family peptidase [Bryobacteraceae bacterium]|nr:M28 family peptidase [Bryobacteraceae bacterium]
MLLRSLALLVAAAALCGQTRNPPLPALIDALRDAVRPDEAMDFMRKVYANDRYFTFPRFHATAEYLRSAMREIGLENIELVEAPADGVTQVGFWTMPLAWDVHFAHLELLDPSIPASERVLADYARVPSSLGMWSGATPKQGIVAEVVELKRGATPSADMRGKLVITNENSANVKWQLVQVGALGAINAFTENPSLRNGRQWVNAWGDSGWAFTKASAPLLSFSITPNQADLLRRLLARGTVRVRAKVDTRYYSGSYPYVTAVIPGSGPEEVLTLGHTSEQGAQDNATGVAATLEALATLKRLIAAGRLPQPRRSIRILSMGEMYGSMHYVAHNRDRIGRTIAAMCVDTPAASYDLSGTEYSFHMNPHVAKDFTDAFILKVASEYLSRVRRPWHEKPFTTGTDTYLAEPMVGVPTVWGYSGSGVETHHNSEDTPDRVDSRSLRDITLIDAAFLYYIANAGEPEALWLARLSESRGYEQILKAAAPFFDESAHTGKSLADAEGRIAYELDREKQSVNSVLRLAPDSERSALRQALAPMLDGLSRFAALQTQRVRSAAEGIQPAPERPNPAAARLIVKRKRFGTIPLDDLPRDQWEGQPSGAWAPVPTIALYWCDGKRSIAEVARLTQFELGPTKFDFVSYFRFLAKHGYVDLIERRSAPESAQSRRSER